MILKIIAAVFAITAVWCLGGAIVTLAVAWLNARMDGGYWFNPAQSQRWTSPSTDLPPPIATFLLWPLVIPISAIYFIGAGFFRETEKLGNKVIELAERQAKAIKNG